jgi:hypothetical protein
LFVLSAPQEVANAYGLSKERIRQIEEKAMRVRTLSTLALLGLLALLVVVGWGCAAKCRHVALAV